jgi:hypothetical protein
MRSMCRLLSILVLTFPVLAVELTEAAKKAFADYVSETESSMSAHRPPALPRLGEVIAIPFAHRKRGSDASIAIPDGLINHWFGATFVPNASIADVRAVLEDYNRYSQYYAPDVSESKLLGRAGDEFDIFLRLHRQVRVKAMFGYSFPVEFNANYKVRYSQESGTLLLRSISTRIAQVRDPKRSHTDEYPVDAGDGFLWRLYSYWRIYEGTNQGRRGVYIESEAMSLSRSVPGFLAKIVTYFTTNFPEESLRSTLEKTRTAVEQRARTHCGVAAPQGFMKSSRHWFSAFQRIAE